MKGELASETVNYDAKSISQSGTSTFQVKQQVSEAAVRRFLKIS